MVNLKTIDSFSQSFGASAYCQECLEKNLIAFMIWGFSNLSKIKAKLKSSRLSLPPFHKPSGAQETNAVLQQSVGHPQHNAILAIVLGASLVEFLCEFLLPRYNRS